MLSTVVIVLGTVLRQPIVLWAFAAVALAGAAGWHLFDAVFNYSVRYALGLPRLPPNPPPRRFAMVLAAVLALLTGWFLARGWLPAGYVAGGMLAIAAVTVGTTHFCLGSLLYHTLVAAK